MVVRLKTYVFLEKLNKLCVVVKTKVLGMCVEYKMCYNNYRRLPSNNVS